MVLNTKTRIISLIIFAFLFSILIRLIPVYQFNDTEHLKFNNEFLISTGDGYWRAEGTRDLIAGFHQKNDKSIVDTKYASASQLTAFIMKILPFQLETIIFYMPAFFSSLIVIPIILIGNSLKRLDMGFVAALMASIAWSYYNRTMVGHYDTDLLNIVLPAFLLWSLILAIQTKEDKYLLISAIDIIIYRWWYPQSYSLEFAFVGLIGIYIIYQFFKKQDINYNLTLITFMLIAMINLDNLLKFIIVVILFIILKIKRDLFIKYLSSLYILFAVAFFLFIYTGGIDPIILKLKGYIFQSSTLTIGGLHFVTPMQTVREATSIPFDLFANRISGHIIIFILSAIGYILMVRKYPVMILTLPMLGLGFLSYSNGLRFTIYAVPIFALAIAFLISELSNLVKNNILKYSLLSILTIAILAPNIKNVIDNGMPINLVKDEAVVLDKLKGIANREDYVVAWWDYGYPIRYYCDVKTLTDGGQHTGYENFLTSFILTNKQSQASKMMRLNVEYEEIKYAKHRGGTHISNMASDYGFKDINKFLTSLQSDIKLPKKTRDIYIYLPERMFNTYHTIKLFSNINLNTGVKGTESFIYKPTRYREDTETIDLDNGVVVHKKTGKITINKKTYFINNIATTFYDKNGKLQSKIQTINPKASFNVVFLSKEKQFFVVDNSVYNSLYFQLFILENYDKSLFEPTIITDIAKVYKLKI
ncbi:MAG: peptide transporter [Epsilonproteobacteria bacterium]|nr:MAG: peptide transporter [Campylobacterota bacterium]